MAVLASYGFYFKSLITHLIMQKYILYDFISL